MKILESRSFYSKVDKDVYYLFDQIKTTFRLNKKEAFAKIVNESYQTYKHRDSIQYLKWSFVENDPKFDQSTNYIMQKNAVIKTRVDDRIYYMFCELKEYFGLNKRNTLEKLVRENAHKILAKAR